MAASEGSKIIPRRMQLIDSLHVNVRLRADITSEEQLKLSVGMLAQLKELMQVKFDELMEQGYNAHCIYMCDLAWSTDKIALGVVNSHVRIDVYGIPPNAVPMWHNIGTYKPSGAKPLNLAAYTFDISNDFYDL